MSERVYMLLDIAEGKTARAIEILRANTGVVLADSLEGRPDVIVMVEAANRQKLAELVMPVLGAVDDITEDVHFLLARGEKQGRRFGSLDLSALKGGIKYGSSSKA
ncbi:MAG: hypothetical protein HY662_04465 [Chloroflexi bacterium]|nr:hypothetical protein [Chloroflexota bacterium]